MEIETAFHLTNSNRYIGRLIDQRGHWVGYRQWILEFIVGSWKFCKILSFDFLILLAMVS